MPLLQKVQPNHLEELRIENCKTSEEIMAQLIEQLNERCYLKKLGLVNVKINEESFDTLCDLVYYSDTLEELDISWAAVRPKKMAQLLKILADNKKIKTINLSNNMLFQESKETPMDEPLTGELQTEEDKVCMEYLCNFLKRNKKLQHVDLSYTGFNEQQLWHIGPTLRRAKSLRSIHLNGNQVTERIVEFLVERTHAENFKHNHIDFRKMPSNRKFAE